MLPVRKMILKLLKSSKLEEVSNLYAYSLKSKNECSVILTGSSDKKLWACITTN